MRRSRHLDCDGHEDDNGRNRKRPADDLEMAAEAKRHNKVMEDIERQRLAREEAAERHRLAREEAAEAVETLRLAREQAAAVLENACVTTNYQLELYDQYCKLIDKNLSLKQIAATFPQYIFFFPSSELSSELTDEEKAEFIRLYKYYTDSVGLHSSITF